MYDYPRRGADLKVVLDPRVLGRGTMIGSLQFAV